MRQRIVSAHHRQILSINVIIFYHKIREHILHQRSSTLGPWTCVGPQKIPGGPQKISNESCTVTSVQGYMAHFLVNAEANLYLLKLVSN